MRERGNTVICPRRRLNRPANRADSASLFYRGGGAAPAERAQSLEPAFAGRLEPARDCFRMDGEALGGLDLRMSVPPGSGRARADESSGVDPSHGETVVEGSPASRRSEGKRGEP